MSLPRDLALSTVDGVPRLLDVDPGRGSDRLAATPPAYAKDSVPITNGSRKLDSTASGTNLLIQATLVPGAAQVSGVTVLGSSTGKTGTRIQYVTETGILQVDRTTSGSDRFLPRVLARVGGPGRADRRQADACGSSSTVTASRSSPVTARPSSARWSSRPPGTTTSPSSPAAARRPSRTSASPSSPADQPRSRTGRITRKEIRAGCRSVVAPLVEVVKGGSAAGLPPPPKGIAMTEPKPPTDQPTDASIDVLRHERARVHARRPRHEVAARLRRHRRAVLRAGRARPGTDPGGLRPRPPSVEPAVQRRTGVDPDRQLRPHRVDGDRLRGGTAPRIAALASERAGRRD